MLSNDQVSTLLRPINPRRVLHSQGQSHLPAFDVVAHLTRVFGFEGWDKEIISIDLVDETLESYKDKAGTAKQGWNVTYRCLMRLTIRDPEGKTVKVIEEGACGSANHLPSKGDAHDFAYKNAISYAIKRCAKDLGDQFGLSLYNKGSTDSILSRIISFEPGEGKDLDGNLPEPKSMGNDEREES